MRDPIEWPCDCDCDCQSPVQWGQHVAKPGLDVVCDDCFEGNHTYAAPADVFNADDVPPGLGRGETFTSSV